jgi:hypothetical protein
MAVLDAWNFPGGASDYATLTSDAAIGHFRTDTGYSAYTVIIVGNMDSLASPGRGNWWSSKRSSNSNINHSINFDPGQDNLEYQYQLGTIFETSSSSETADVWCAYVYSYAGGTGNVRIRRIPLSTATQSHTQTGAPGGSNFDDAQAQTVELGGSHNGSSVQAPLDGQIALVLILKGTELSQGQCEAFAADPLNEGDALCQAHGTNCFFWDDTGADSGDNGLAAPTLNGSVTRGTGNGPTVPDRDVPAGSDGPTLTSVGDFGIIYYGEQHVTIVGTNFGTVEPIVVVNQDPDLPTGTALDVFSFTTTQIVFNMAASGITGASQVWVTNQTPGVSFGLSESRSVEVRADPGSDVVALRIGIPSVNMQSGVAISLNTKKHFYHRGAQEALTYSKPTGAFPTGLAIGSSTGLITGTIDSGAASGSPYNAVVRATDNNGAFADQAVNWTVTTTTPTGKSSGSWGRRQPR